MSIRLNWKPNASLSHLYAAACLADYGGLSDQRAESVIGESVEQIGDRLAYYEVDPSRFWWRLVQLSRTEKDSGGRVGVALQHAGCSPLVLDQASVSIQGRLTDIRIAFDELYPKLSQQLPLRCGPLKEQWEAVGPGLLNAIAEEIHRDLMPPRVEINVVHPAAGGGGFAAAEEGWLVIEGMLTNPNPRVPETVRLAWLISQVGLARSGSSRLVPSERLGFIAAVALLPIALHAGCQLELVDSVQGTLLETMELWRMGSVDGKLVWDWWEQTQGGETPFPVALKALDRMFAARLEGTL